MITVDEEKQLIEEIPQIPIIDELKTDLKKIEYQNNIEHKIKPNVFDVLKEEAKQLGIYEECKRIANQVHNNLVIEQQLEDRYEELEPQKVDIKHPSLVYIQDYKNIIRGLSNTLAMRREPRRDVTLFLTRGIRKKYKWNKDLFVELRDVLINNYVELVKRSAELRESASFESATPKLRIDAMTWDQANSVHFLIELIYMIINPSYYKYFKRLSREYTNISDMLLSLWSFLIIYPSVLHNITLPNIENTNNTALTDLEIVGTLALIQNIQVGFVDYEGIIV